MVKNILIFLAGVVTGVGVLIALGLYLNSQNSLPNGVTLYDSPGELIERDAFEVIQVLDSGDALAKTCFAFGMPTLTVLFPGSPQTAYYDNQIIRIPEGKCIRQIGVFRYTSKIDQEKTVPIVDIFDN